MLYLEEYPVTDEPEVPEPRSRRIYVYWGVALSLLLGLGRVRHGIVPGLQKGLEHLRLGGFGLWGVATHTVHLFRC